MSALWSCKNGVIDFKQKKFFHGTRVEFDPECSQTRVGKLVEILQRTFPVGEDLDLFLDQLYLTMTGQVREDTIILLTGPGNSGKSIIYNLLSALFASYSIRLPSSFLKNDEEISILPSMEDARLIISTEVKEVDRDLVSKITRGAQKFRELYSDKTIQKAIDIWCFANEKFEVDPSIKVIHIPFRSQFTKTPEEGEGKEFSFVANTLLAAEIHQHVSTLLWLMLHR